MERRDKINYYLDIAEAVLKRGTCLRRLYGAVIVNNDEQAKLKTGKDTVFQDQDFRMKIVSSLKVVDEVYLSIDTDGSVCESIK